MVTDNNGLYYMRARCYNPEIRRFINQDIVIGNIENSQSLNRYAYCQGNPVNYLDPFGLEPCEFFSGLGHGMLNFMGLIPGIGDAFDITNAIWYAFDGKWGRCFESGIAALPFIGNFLPDRRTCDYVRRVLNIASYGGTGFLAGQGMIDGGQQLWTEINSGQCSGWSIALGVANIGLNGVTLFFSGKGFVQETGNLNKMLKADGVTDGLLGPLMDNGGYLDIDGFKDIFKNPSAKINGNSYDINKLQKTQPYVYPETVSSIKEKIVQNGPNSVLPIEIRVHNTQVLVVDGHNRLEAFRQLGYDRVPIKYLHSSQLGKILSDGNYYRPLQELLDAVKVSN